MTLLMEGPATTGAPALAEAPPRVEEVDAARADALDADALLAEAFGFTITHRGREAEVVMADVTLCCSTCCSCSSKQQPR
ncbi:hypothetical protein QFZ62_002322 [Clavibacter sp. B3I6]|jgi:hypothetical protein|uniref:hypothetical protein n=1 Tax=Clavibacter sp. B3I6 TaxID=3042268 RepID=UPI0027806D3C|nr:hypothetical protein [Clavibacter sp. B3I6]MDQ0745014.1 hypothetical protein [Clavibacter sp. B3I6]